MSTAHSVTSVPELSLSGIWLHDPANTDPEVYRLLSNKLFAKLHLEKPATAEALLARLETTSEQGTLLFEDLFYQEPPSLIKLGEVLINANFGKTGFTQATSAFPNAKSAFRKLWNPHFDPQFWLIALHTTTSPVERSCLTNSAINPEQIASIVLTENSTVPVRDKEAEARFRFVFQRGAEEEFEDGMESEFSRELESLVTIYGSASKPILARLLDDAEISPRVWAEALRWLGRLHDPASHEARLWVLEKGLSSMFPIVRDGAALGLSSMDDPAAIPYLQRAVDSEVIAELRTDMEQILSQLVSQK
jgi:hypothetical protein